MATKPVDTATRQVARYRDLLARDKRAAPLGVLLLVTVGIGLLAVVVRRLGRHEPAQQHNRAGVLVAVAAAVSVAVVTWAAGHPSWSAAAYGGVALVVLGVAMFKLLPAGTLRGLPGLPTVVAALALAMVAVAVIGVSLTRRWPDSGHGPG